MCMFISSCQGIEVGQLREGSGLDAGLQFKFFSQKRNKEKRGGRKTAGRLGGHVDLMPLVLLVLIARRRVRAWDCDPELCGCAALLRMGDDLQDKPRKELKELCSRNNIRTAGVKHEDLVRLLRNKLYPASPSTPRSKSLRGPKEQSPVKDSYKTPVTIGGNKARTSRTSTLPREVQKEFQRKNSGLARKPLLTKSNTLSSRSRVGGAPGGADPQQESAYRRPGTSKVKGLSPLSREAPGQLETAAMSISQSETSRVEGDDSGSDASRRVSEVATDAGPDTMSDFSDADEFRSVSSEPISRLGLSKRSSGLRTESSKMSLLSAQSGLSFFTADSWSSENSQSLENLRDDVFPMFPDGSNFLADALEVSFLDAGAADPDAVGFTAMQSPMARDYVNYSRGSETDAGASSRLAEEGKQSKDMVDGETTSEDAASVDDHQSAVDAPTQSEPCDDGDVVATQPTLETEARGEESASPAIDTPTQSEPCARDVTATQLTGETEAQGEESASPAESEPCARGEDVATQPTPENGLPEGEEAASPANFDYSDVAKKLEFEPVEITTSSLPDSEDDESKSQKMEPAAAHVPVETEGTTVHPPDSSPSNTPDPTEKADSPVDLHVGKSGVEHCEAVVHDNNKPSPQDGREKEDAALSFPLSVMLWCTQSCSSTSGSRTS